jgi:hypothetical protein
VFFGVAFGNNGTSRVFFSAGSRRAHRVGRSIPSAGITAL